ncbi:MAG: NifU family protein [Syntrophales bacterium]
MKKKVEEVIAKLRPLLGSADIAVKDISEGVLTLKILTSSCAEHVSIEMIIEIIEDQLKEDVPEIKKVVEEVDEV